jgi:hypothetical protein
MSRMHKDLGRMENTFRNDPGHSVYLKIRN